MKYNVEPSVTIEAILANKAKWESDFEIPIETSDVELVVNYLLEVKEVDGLAKFLHDMSILPICYITYDVGYDVAFNAFYFNVLFDGNNVGLGLVILDDQTILVIDTMGS